MQPDMNQSQQMQPVPMAAPQAAFKWEVSKVMGMAGAANYDEASGHTVQWPSE